MWELIDKSKNDKNEWTQIYWCITKIMSIRDICTSNITSRKKFISKLV